MSYENVRTFHCPVCDIPYDWGPLRIYSDNVFCSACAVRGHTVLIIRKTSEAQKMAILLQQTESISNHNPLRETEHCMKPEQKDSVTETLKERQSTHGEFRENSKVSHDLRNVIKDSFSQSKSEELTTYQEEAIVMICHKLARICAGNDKFADHWKDIAGYAKLVSDRLEEDYPNEQ